jgi:hypothetical protein
LIALGQGLLKILNVGGNLVIHPNVAFQTDILRMAGLATSRKDGLEKFPPKSFTMHDAQCTPRFFAAFAFAVFDTMVLNFEPVVISEI